MTQKSLSPRGSKVNSKINSNEGKIVAVDTTITDEQRNALRAALTSPELFLVSGQGDADTPGVGQACTITEISLVLIGRLDDGPHPCICNVIRRWVIRIQDDMPDEIRNSAAWREAAIGIAGSAANLATEKRRVEFLLNWMWEALADKDVLASIPESIRSVWNEMLSKRSADAATATCAADAVRYAAAIYAAAAAANAAAISGAAATAAARAADAVRYVAASHAYWERRNLAGTLAALIAIDEN